LAEQGLDLFRHFDVDEAPLGVEQMREFGENVPSI